MAKKTNEVKEEKAPKYEVRNPRGVVVSEFKPGIGEFIIQPGEKIEIKDVKNEKGEVLYSAKEIAESIVKDAKSLKDVNLEIIVS